jgi:hypothetical protein
MDTLHERLADLADDAPTGGAPPTELWARGKRAQRRRATALALAVLVVGAVGTGIGVRLVDGTGKAADPEPATPVNISLPITYPEGETLPDLGDAPGPLAAIWLAPRRGTPTIEVVGLVAGTGTFGTLPIDLPRVADDPENPFPAPGVGLELSPDGRRIVYSTPADDGLVVRDLVSGEEQFLAFDFGIRTLDGWVDDTHLLGRVGGGFDADGWVWEPGSAPTLVDFYSVSHGESGLGVPINGGGRSDCSAPTLQDVRFRAEHGGQWAGAFDVPGLCDVLGITDSGSVLGHWRDPGDGNGTVVALNVRAADPPLGVHPARMGAADFADPAQRHVIAAAGGPQRVVFATGLIAQAIEDEGGAS